MPASHRSAPRWARRKDDRPQELLTAALDLFVERGYAATRLEDVGARAGVSKGTLYLYFDSKEALFKSVVRQHILPLLDEADALVEQFDGPSTALFRNLLHGWWQRIGDTKLAGITKLMMAEAGNFPELAQFYHEEVMSRSDALFVRMFERGIARGEFRSVNAVNATRVVMAPMLMLMLWKHSFGACTMLSTPPQEYLDSVIDLCLHGLLAPGQTAPQLNECDADCSVTDTTARAPHSTGASASRPAVGATAKSTVAPVDEAAAVKPANKPVNRSVIQPVAKPAIKPAAS